jgi:hypothetical protein
MGAAARRSQRVQDRRERLVSKAHQRAGSVVARLDAEVEREIERVNKWEQKLTADPIKTLKLAYEFGVWSSKPLEDKTGAVQYSLGYTVESVPSVSFEPAFVVVGGNTLTPLAVAISQYFTAVAFDAVPPAQGGGRLLKLVSQAKPENSQIAIAAPDGDTFLPTDTSLDGRLFAGARRTGIVAFEAFPDAVDHFDVVFAPPKGGEPTTIRVTALTMRGEIEKELSAPGVADSFAQGLREQQTAKKAEVDAVLAKTKGGCLVLIATGSGLLGIAMTLAAMRLP